MNDVTGNLSRDARARNPKLDAKETSESNKNSDNFARTFGAKPTRKSVPHDETTPGDPEQAPSDQDPEGEPEPEPAGDPPAPPPSEPETWDDPADEPWPAHLAQQFDALGLMWREVLTSWTAAGAATPRQAVDRCTRHLRSEGWPLADVVELASRTPLGFGILATSTAWVIREIWTDVDKEEANEAAKKASAAKLAGLLSIDAWTYRDIPPPDRLMGDLVTTTTRTFLVGRTGLGKTMLGFALAAHIAAGVDFLGWKAGRPARVLYIDGEMPAELIKERSIDVLRRLGAKIPRGNLMIFGGDIEAEARRICPTLPPFAPLNTDGGQQFLFALLDAIGGADLVVFDNVMSLVEGDQKDEVSWSPVLTLVNTLTERRIGQIWLDHTGHDSSRQYGSSTKAWRFDSIGIMTPLAESESDPRATAFALSFGAPGKSRRRTPHNWRDFESRTIRLLGDRWTYETVARSTPAEKAVPPSRAIFYEALLAAITHAGTGPGETTRAAWEEQCVTRGLIDPDGGRNRTQLLRTAQSVLLVARWIAVDGDRVIDLKGRWE